MMNANTGILMRALSSLPVISSEGTGTSIATNCMNDSIHHFILITGQTTVASNVNPKTAANCQHGCTYSAGFPSTRPYGRIKAWVIGQTDECPQAQPY